MSALSQAEFVAEAKEHLSEVCHQLLQLERAGEAGHSTRIHSMLRAIHSIKGGAGFFGWKHVEQLAHQMESTLEGLLDDAGATTNQVIDVLLEATDRITGLLDHSDPLQAESASDVIEKMQTLKLSSPTSSSTPAIESSLVIRPDEPTVAMSKADAGEPAETSLPQRGSLLDLKVDLRACEEMGFSPLNVMDRILKVAQIESGSLDLPASGVQFPSNVGPFHWNVRLWSELDLPELVSQSGLPAHAVFDADAAYKPEPAAKLPAAVHGESTTELSQPLQHRQATIRIPLELTNRLVQLAGELVLVRNQARRFAEYRQPLPPLVAKQFDTVTSDVQTTVLRTRMQPIGTLFQRFPRLIRDLARQLGKQIELQLEGTDVELDKTILDAISDPLTHLVRNACDHGIEPPNQREQGGKPAVGRLRLSARQVGDQIWIEIRDDGKGIDPQVIARKAQELNLRDADELRRMDDRELLNLIFHSGFSTASSVTDVSGRGVGMDVVRTNVTALGGNVEIHSKVSRGTTFTLRLPLTLAIIPSLLVEIAGHAFVLPQRDLESMVRLDAKESRTKVEWTRGQAMLRWRGHLVPLVHLPYLTGDPQGESTKQEKHATNKGEHILMAVLRVGDRHLALAIDRVLTSEEIVVQPLHPQLRWLGVYSGATILGDGRIALILHAEGIARVTRARFVVSHEARVATPQQVRDEPLELLLVRTLLGQWAAVATRTVRRVTWVRPGDYQWAGSQAILAIDGDVYPAGVLDTAGTEMPLRELSQSAFALIVRQNRRWACIVQDVLGTVTVLESQLQTMRTDSAVIGAVEVEQGVTAIVDLAAWVDQMQDSQPLEDDKPNSRILVVDDTEFFRNVIAQHLESAGFMVTVAHHGLEALEILRTQSIHLMVSDLEMPEMDGFHLAQSVRRLPTFETLPLLALTTLTDDDSKRRALACGFDAYEIKLNPDSLLSKIRELLVEQRRRAPIAVS